jgi:iron complex outermembrane receptor protein
MSRFASCAALAALLWVGPAVVAAAERQETGGGPLPPDQVLTAPRRIPGRTLPISRFPGNVTVITLEQIRDSGASTVPGVLAVYGAAGVMDAQGFGTGADGAVTLRGVNNSARANALVLLNGVRQNRITGDEVHWQSIPADQVERIEIIRGGGGTTYGEGALAGVINIVTKQPGAEPVRVEYGSEWGSYGWQKYHAGARGSTEPVRYGVHATRRLVQGYRESSQSRNTTVVADLGATPVEGLSADLHVLHSEDTTGFPGLITLTQSQARREQTNAFFGVNDNMIDQVSLDLTAGPWEGWSGALTAFWRRWLQYSSDSINFNAFTVTPSRGVSGRLNHEWTAGTVDLLLSTGFDVTQDKATTGDPGAGADSESNRDAYGFYIEDTLTVMDRVSVTGGLRFDKARYEESLVFPAFDGSLRFEGWSPRLGVVVNAVPGTLDVFASYARPFKSPNVDDFSSRLGSSFGGNADLEPQQADTYEAGVRAWRGPLSASATAFFLRTEDEILFNPLTFSNQNFDTQRGGLELTGGFALDRLRGRASYTFVDAEFRNGTFTERTLPGTPEHLFAASVGVSPLPRLWVDLQWQLTHDYVRFNDVNNALIGADNYGVLSLVCQYHLPRPADAPVWRPDGRVFARVENLTNEEYVQFQSSNGVNPSGAGEAPATPINFVVGLSVEF